MNYTSGVVAAVAVVVNITFWNNGYCVVGLLRSHLHAHTTYEKRRVRGVRVCAYVCVCVREGCEYEVRNYVFMVYA